MTKFPLTAKQQDMLRAVVKGIDESKIPQTWSFYYMQTERQDRDLETKFGGIPLLEELDVQDSDLSLFAGLGFLTAVEVTTKGGTYHLKEQALRNAVYNDFADPSSAASSPRVQAIFNAPIYGSNVSVAEVMDHFSQSVSSLPNLCGDNKATLEALISDVKQQLIPFQESHPKEVSEVTRSVDLMMGDLAEHPRDNENLGAAIARLKRAGVKFMFSTAAHVAVNKLAEFVEGLLHVAT